MKLKGLIVIILLCLFTAGCNIGKKTQEVANNMAQKGEDKSREIVNQGQQKANEMINAGKGQVQQLSQAAINEITKKLSNEAKKKIDEWLKAKGLNQYGDAIGTMYAGGTPLFNEVTGQTIDRYEYIIKKYPELINQYNLK